MRICFLNQAPKRSAAYEAATIEAQLNSYASPGTKVEIVFPDDYEGSQLYRDHRLAERAQRSASHDGDAGDRAEDLLGGAERLRRGDLVEHLRSRRRRRAARGQHPGDRAAAHLDARCAHARRPRRHHRAARRPRALHLAHPAHATDSTVSSATSAPIGVYGKDIAERKNEIFDITDQAHPRPDRRDARRDHPAARRRAHPLRGQSRRSREGDRRRRCSTPRRSASASPRCAWPSA